MKRTEYLAVVAATLVAIAIALASPFLSPGFVRPGQKDALAIIDAVADYDFRLKNAEFGGRATSEMSESTKRAQIRIIDAAPCGAIVKPLKCYPIDTEGDGGLRRLLAASWHDANVNLARYADISAKNPLPKYVAMEDLRSPLGERLLRLQIAAADQLESEIEPSGLSVSTVRKRIKMRGDTFANEVRTYFAPWLAGDIAFMQVDLYCGDMCGEGTVYALRKQDGKWHVEAIQLLWIA